MISITHDLGIIAENAERVVVMYAGREVEEATARDLGLESELARAVRGSVERVYR